MLVRLFSLLLITALTMVLSSCFSRASTSPEETPEVPKVSEQQNLGAEESQEADQTIGDSNTSPTQETQTETQVEIDDTNGNVSVDVQTGSSDLPTPEEMQELEQELQSLFGEIGIQTNE